MEWEFHWLLFQISLNIILQNSEKIYTATKIKYEYKQFEDSIREYAKKQIRTTS